MGSMILRLGLVFIFSLMTLSCVGAPNQDPNTLVVGIESMPQIMDPRFSVDATSQKIGRLIYRGLFKKNKDLKIVPDLAQSFEVIGDKDIRVTLKQGLKFHDGSLLDAQDVKATIESIINPKNKSPHRFVFDKIQEIKIEGNHLTFILKEPFAPILTALTMGILPSEIVNSKFKPIGLGPFYWVRAKDNEKIELKRFENYEGKKVAYQNLIFKIILDDTLRTLELIHGRLDLVQNAIPPILLKAIEKRSDYLKLDKGEGINFNYMGLKLDDSILKNEIVRKALALGINRKEIIQYKLKNMGTLATSLLSPQHWAFNNKLKPFEYDPTKANALLESNGFPLKGEGQKQSRFKLVYKTSTKKDRVEIALLIAHQLKKIGIDVEVKPYEWGTFFRDIRTGEFQIYTLTWVGLTDPDIYYYAFHSEQMPPKGANRGRYQNKELDQVVVTARTTLDDSKRAHLYKQAQAIIFNDYVYIPLWYENNFVVYNKRVKNYHLRLDAGFDDLVNVTLTGESL